LFGKEEGMADEPAVRPEQEIDPPESLVGNTPPLEDSGDSRLHEEDTSPENKPPEDKPPENKLEEENPIPRAPAEYAEFKLPEGVQFDESGMSDFKSFAKEQDLTQEQAQKVLEFGAGQLKEWLSAPYKTWNEMQTKWQAEVKADPEIGGTKFEQSIKDASLVFTAGESNPFVSSAEEAQALRQALNTTGAGNNPAMVKLFVKMGRLLSEPGPLSGNPNLAVNERKGPARTLEEKMYTTMIEPVKTA
jgi:hypothetical protein